jgi:DHA1 family multidrug resistance protein-like MFS transporter
MTSRADPGGSAIPRPQGWRALLVVFWVTSLVEGSGVSQIYAFLPHYLTEMGVTGQDRLQFVGVFSSLVFVVGAPLVPLWGVWADKYSRKAVIIRSSLVEAVVFGAVALSREPWQLAISVMLIGLQLGNTGVMLAAIRDVTPTRRLGTAIALFGASGPIGFAVGPVIGGIVVDGLGLGLPVVFAISSVMSIGAALLVAVGSREVRPQVVPQGAALRLAYGAIRGVVSDRGTRRVFAVFGVSFLATQMARPYIPVLVERLNTSGTGLASDIALVAGTAALVGALVSPLGGAIGDRIGFRPVLVGALVVGGLVIALAPYAPSVLLLALTALVFATTTAMVTAMVFGLLATEVPPERRSATLNLVYLPLYAAGLVGPLAGSVVVTAGLPAPFLVAGGIIMLTGIVLATRRRTRAAQPGSSPAPA